MESFVVVRPNNLDADLDLRQGRPGSPPTVTVQGGVVDGVADARAVTSR